MNKGLRGADSSLRDLLVPAEEHVHCCLAYCKSPCVEQHHAGGECKGFSAEHTPLCLLYA